MECSLKDHGTTRREAESSHACAGIIEQINLQTERRPNGKYILGPCKDSSKQTLHGEARGELLDLPDGILLHAHQRPRRPMPFKLNTDLLCLVPKADLAASLRATFNLLNIDAKILEVDEGVWVSDTTIDNLAEWSKHQPTNMHVLPADQLKTGEHHWSSGPRKFASVFDRILQAQSQAHGR